MATRISDWLKNIALVLSSLVFALVLIELGLRILSWSFPLFAQPDRDLGWSFRPGVSGWSTHENTAYLRMNRYGFRGPNWTERPASGTIRIAMLGDSFVDSSNLADEDALTQIVEKEMGSCSALANRRVEVLNFGVSGYGTTQQYLQLQQKVANFHPDLVLLAFYSGNDVTNNSRALSVEGQKAKPYYVETADGGRRLDMSFRDSNAFRQEVNSDWKRRLINHSYLLQVLKQVLQGKAAMPSPLVFSNKLDAQPRRIGLRPEAIGLYGRPENDVWRSAWSVTEQVLQQMQSWTQQQKIGFGLVIIPDPIQVLPGESWRADNAAAIKAADLDYPARRIAQFAAQNSIAYLNLLDPFRSYGDSQKAFLYGFPPKLGNGHLNAAGNRVGGKLIAEWVCGQLIR